MIIIPNGYDLITIITEDGLSYDVQDVKELGLAIRIPNLSPNMNILIDKTPSGIAHFGRVIYLGQKEK